MDFSGLLHGLTIGHKSFHGSMDGSGTRGEKLWSCSGHGTHVCEVPDAPDGRAMAGKADGKNAQSSVIFLHH